MSELTFSDEETSSNHLPFDVKALEQRGYTIGKKIGRGSFATVHIAEYSNASTSEKRRLACKIFDKKKAPPTSLNKFLPRELDILAKIRNHNLIHVHSIFEYNSRVFIFMQYADNGDLLEYILKNGSIPECKARTWLKQLAYGLKYLHGMEIAHRDIKCENILLCGDDVKLGDFGFARFCRDHWNRNVLSETFCGSPAYAAPEIIKATPYDPKISDVWSLGVVLFLMLNCYFPFDDSSLRRLIICQMSSKFVMGRGTSAKVKSLVRRMLEPNVHLRFTPDRVLKHRWTCAKETPIYTIQTRSSARKTEDPSAEICVTENPTEVFFDALCPND